VSDNSFSPETAKDSQQHPYFEARVAVTSARLRDVPADFRLIPGMAATAEIKAGERSVLSYLLYPLLRGLDESMREP
jgi:HlyD family secretion protein